MKKLILAGSIIILSSLKLFSQETFKTIQLCHDVSGSGLGENISIGFGFSKGNHLLSMNANFQKKKVNLSGVNLNYKYIVYKGEDEKTELFFSGNVTVHAKAYLSENSIRIERLCNPENTENYKSLSLNVFESYIGVGLKFNHTTKISTIYNIGYGGYTTLNKNFNYNMYRRKSGQALQFQFTLMYRI